MDQFRFKRLCESVNIADLQLRNRMVMPPMGTGLASRDGFVTDKMVDYYEARAMGGVGLVIVEAACTEFPRGLTDLYRLRLDVDSCVPGMARLAETIKKQGARAAIQIGHAGGIARISIAGITPISASAIDLLGTSGGELPHQLSKEEIQHQVSLFAQAAVRAVKAGFEGIEIHAAHGYLLAQFISPYCNHRQDAYGGSTENRFRILDEVLKAVRSKVGKDFPLWCRINGREYGVDGLTIDQAKAIARKASHLADAVHVSAWGWGNEALAYIPDVPGAFLSLAADIKSAIGKPVIAVGRITPELAEQAVDAGKIDMVAWGRELMADPELPKKIINNELRDIRPCLACFYCHDARTPDHPQISCSVNASLGNEKGYVIGKALKAKRVSVVGGGPAGMEAARVLALRGHKVTLVEKDGSLGGQVLTGMRPPHKQERLSPLTEYYIRQLEKLGVSIRLNHTATLQNILDSHQDIVVLATGASPAVPNITGVGQSNVVTASDILRGKVEAGKNAVVVGGGSIGCETAEYLIAHGKSVTVVEMLPELAKDMGRKDRFRLLTQLDRLPIRILTRAKCEEIQATGVVVVAEQGQQFIPADTIVLAVGMKPVNYLFALFKEKGVETYLIGDGWQVGRIATAIADGTRLGCTL